MIILRRFDPLSCSLKKVHVSMNKYACTLFNEQDKGPNLLSIITWSVLGKQNVQAKKVYCTHVVCCLHYNFLLSRITMLLYISVYHEFIKRAIASSTFPGVMFLFHKYWDFFHDRHISKFGSHLRINREKSTTWCHIQFILTTTYFLFCYFFIHQLADGKT